MDSRIDADRQSRFLVDTLFSKSLILFLDCSRGLDNFKTLLFACISVSFVGSLLVLLLLIFLSGRIVRPFLQYYEKQKQFITDAGHELKTPLTILNADAEILAMDYGKNEWVSDIQAQTRCPADLTNDPILLSRMEEEQTQLQMLELPLSDIAEETIAPFQTVTRTQSKRLALHIQPMLSMRGDEKSLRKLFSILLDNAVKYSSPHSTISCTLEQQKISSSCRSGMRSTISPRPRLSTCSTGFTAPISPAIRRPAAMVRRHRTPLLMQPEAIVNPLSQSKKGRMVRTPSDPFLISHRFHF